jgi:hypothetical protein
LGSFRFLQVAFFSFGVSDSDFGGGAFIRASDKCQKEKRKTINGEDLLWAMATLGFEEYVDPLKNYLQKYREVSDGSCNYCVDVDPFISPFKIIVIS